MEEKRREALKKLGLLSVAGLASGLITLSDASVNPAAADSKKSFGTGKSDAGGSNKKAKK